MQAWKQYSCTWAFIQSFGTRNIAPNIRSRAASAKCWWMRPPSGTTWSWKGRRDGSIRQPACWDFHDPTTLRAVMDIYIWHIAGNGGFAPRTCFSRIGGGGNNLASPGVGMSADAARTSVYATKATYATKLMKRSRDGVRARSRPLRDGRGAG